MSEERIFTHDKALQKAVSWYASQGLVEDMRPENVLEMFSTDFLGECEKGAGKRISASDALYYLLLEHRRVVPGFYPPHDICLALANLIQAGGHAGKLLVLDPKLVPLAILLANHGREIALPKEAETIGSILTRHIKGATFTELPNEPDKDAVVLDGDPRLCLEKGKSDYINEASGAICLTNWDFLGVRANEFYRRYWLEKSGVSGVLQLPRLKRQGSAAYPSIMLMSGNRADIVRMGRIEKADSGKGAIDQSLALSLMLEAPDGIDSIDIEKKKILSTPSCILTPAVWLKAVSPKSGKETTQLGKCVQIIRCQLKRIKLPDDEEVTFGRQPDGAFIAREMAMTAMQPQCGILLDGCGDTVRIEFKRRDSEFKYLLKKGDLLFAFRGTMESLGKVGYVDREPLVPSITGTAFYLLRPLADINPVWLFWELQSSEVRKEILAKSSGTTMLSIGVEDVSAVPIRQPGRQELDEIMRLHSEMAEKTSQISASMLEIGEKRKQIASLIK